ncbi:MAG TPA: hypothetical protein VFH06_00515 [Candidatus Saccharimonadales bacterium]|nr:hypothetical protein [Candidatus Saccharimonadales bacterium]
MTHISPEQLAANRQKAQENHRQLALEHQRRLHGIRELRTNPNELSIHERRERFEDAQRFTANHEGVRNNRRFFTKRDASGVETPYAAFVHPEVFAPYGYLGSNFSEVAEDPSKRNGAQHMANWFGEKIGGSANIAIFAMENGDAIAMRRLKAGDPRLPKSVIQAQEQARARGIDPDLSANYQYFEVRSSKSLREGNRHANQGRLIHSSALKEMVVIPGLPLKFNKDEHSGVIPRETEEAVAAVFTLDDTEKGKLPDGRLGIMNDPNNNLNDLREEVGEALGTGKRVVRSLGNVGLRNGAP